MFLFESLQRYFLPFLLTYLLSVNALLADTYDIDKIINSAIELELDKHPMWIKLLHYEQDLFSKSKLTSAIHSEGFFLSDRGSSSPSKELAATIKAFYNPIKDDQNRHPQCLFPARYLWLKSKLALPTSSLELNCQNFNEWTQQQSISSVSLLYANGYLGNPASYYGHTLLKFNSTNKSKSQLLEMTANYGAVVDNGDGPITYMLKGVFGGYDGSFSNIEFYFHEQNYGELELRDIWEYKLNLPKQDVDLIVAHSWELLAKDFTYFFFRENCAYRVAEVLELSDSMKGIIPSQPWTFPQSIVSSVNKPLNNNTSNISSIIYHPSRQTRFYDKYDQLNKKQRIIFKSLINNISGVNSAKFNSLAIKSQQLLLETVQDYLSFVHGSERSFSEETKSKYNQVLVKRFSLPIGRKNSTVLNDHSPHEGRKPGLIQVSPTYNEQLGEGISITLRPSYYDALDSNKSHVAHSALTMFDTKVSYFDNELFLRHLNLVNIESVNTARTGLPGDNGKTWKLKLGVEQQNLKCTDCLVAKLQADIGITQQVADDSIIGAYIGGAVQNNRNDNGPLYSKLSIFSNVSISPNLKLRSLVESRYHFNSDINEEMLFQLEGRYAINNQWDLRALVEKNKVAEYTMSLGYYW